MEPLCRIVGRHTLIARGLFVLEPQEDKDETKKKKKKTAL